LLLLFSCQSMIISCIQLFSSLRLFRSSQLERILCYSTGKGLLFASPKSSKSVTIFCSWCRLVMKPCHPQNRRQAAWTSSHQVIWKRCLNVHCVSA
jgi:hypothetical protein